MATGAPRSQPSPTREAQIEKALRRIVIPKLELHDASLGEAIAILAADIRQSDPTGHGISIALAIDPKPETAPSVPPKAAASPESPGENPLLIGDPHDARVTVTLTNIPVDEALRYLTGLSNTAFYIQSDGVHIVPLNAPELMKTRDFEIPPDFFPAFEKDDELTHANRAGEMKNDFGAYLAANHILLPTGAAVILNDQGTRLTVHAMQDQLENIAQILKTDRPPSVPGPKTSKVIDGDLRFPDSDEASVKLQTQAIVFPEVTLENVNLIEAAGILYEMTVHREPNSRGRSRGVTIVPEAYQDADGKTVWPTISYHGKNVTLAAVLEAIAHASQRVIRVKNDVVVLEKAKPDDRITRTYLVPPMTREEMEKSNASAPAEQKRAATTPLRAEDFLPAKSAESKGNDGPLYIARKRWLVVSDTEANHQLIRKEIEHAWLNFYSAHPPESLRTP